MADPIDPTQPPQATINVVDPYGQQMTIPLSELGRATERGYRVASGDEVTGKERQEKYDQPVAAFGEGAVRGLTFGLSDIGGTDAMAYRRQYNPIAAGTGEIAGSIAGVGVTGLGGAARAAGKAVLSGSGILARAGAAAIGTATEGAAIGLGQGISDVALSQDPMSAESIVGSLTHHILSGAGIGAVAGGALSLGGSAIGGALQAASKGVARVADKIHGELVDGASSALADADPALRTEVMSKPQLDVAATAERSALDASRAQQGTALAKDLESFRADVGSELGTLKDQLPRGQEFLKDISRPTSKLQNLVGDLKTLAEDPSSALGPLRRIEQQYTKMATVLPEGTVQPTLDRLTQLQNRIGDLTGDATSPRLEAIQAQLESLGAKPKATPILDSVTKGAGAAVGGAIGHATGIPYAGVAGAWVGKEIAGAVKPMMKKVLGAFVDNAGAITQGIETLGAKLGAPSPALDALQDLASAGGVTGASAYERAAKVVSDAAANQQQTSEVLRQQLAGLSQGAPQLADQVHQGMLLKVQFLASKLIPQVSMGLGQLIPPSDAEVGQFARYAAAANDPLRVLKELGAMQLMPETIETHEALYPTMLARLRQQLTERLADPKAAAKVSYPMRLEIGRLLGGQGEPTLDPSFVALMQQPFSQPKQGGKAPGGSSTDPTKGVTEAQRLTMK